ncbi:MAG: cation:proton antiporter [Candidatus Eisenbacteria bacterium]
MRGLLPMLVVGVLLAHVASAAAASGGVDMLPILEALILILLGAKLGGSLFERFGLPSVLGELAVGIALGNLGLLGMHGFDSLRRLPVLDVLAQIGVLFLLFAVGLESNVAKMVAVGPSALLVAVLGVVAPMLLGYGVSAWYFPAQHVLAHWFVGATLAATSVGITARVLGDLGEAAGIEGRIILGAAVIDDVLGLIVLAVVTGVIHAADSGRAFQPSQVLLVVGKAVGFIGAAVFVGQWISKGAFALASRMRGQGLLLSFALAFCFLLSFVAGKLGLAPIVGAFAAGLVLDEVQYQDLLARDGERRSLEHLLEPLSGFLVPIFFVLMGTRVDLAVFGRTDVLAFAGVLTLAAVAGKQVCALGVLEKGADRIAVGLGMIPRGEVGLIFAQIGAGLQIRGERVIGDGVFSAVVVMVALTTLLTPPLLVWRLRGR